MIETCGKDPVLRVVNLEVSVAATGRMLLDDIHFEVRPGESLAVIGESGAGKSVMLRALSGLLDEGLTARGSVWLHSTEILHGRSPFVRGRKILYLNQQAMTAFDPLSTIGEQLEQTVRTHFPALSGSEIEAEIVSVLKRLRFADPRAVLSRCPSELSGGMLQRAMMAVVALLKPEVIVADEPTSAVDVPSMRKILGMLCDIRRQTKAALIVATHDLAFAQALAERFVVMKSGRILESGTIEILHHPRHPYLKHLIEMRRRTSASFEEIVSGRDRSEGRNEIPACVFLSADGLSKRFCRDRASFFSRARSQEVIRDASFELRRGEVVGLVGASGEGKSTLSRLLLGLEKPDSGTVFVEGTELGKWLRANPGGMSLVSQNYVDSVDPSWTVREILSEPIRLQMRRFASRSRQLQAEISEAALCGRLAEVGLASSMLERRPGTLSGGELQRVCIARALTTRPKFLVFDEALSSLDASVQGEILQLLSSLVRQATTWLFISHDLRVVATLCTRVLFLHDAEICEDVPVQELGKVRSPWAAELVKAAF